MIELTPRQMGVVRLYAPTHRESALIPDRLLEELRELHPCRFFPEGAVRTLPDLEGRWNHRILIRERIENGCVTGFLAFIWRESGGELNAPLCESEQRRTLRRFARYALIMEIEGSWALRRRCWWIRIFQTKRNFAHANGIEEFLTAA